MKVSDTPSHVTHWSCDHVTFQKNALFPLPLTMAAENAVHLEKNAEMSPIKDEFLVSYSKQKFW